MPSRPAIQDRCPVGETFLDVGLDGQGVYNPPLSCPVVRWTGVRAVRDRCPVMPRDPTDRPDPLPERG